MSTMSTLNMLQDAQARSKFKDIFSFFYFFLINFYVEYSNDRESLLQFIFKSVLFRITQKQTFLSYKKRFFPSFLVTKNPLR